MFIFFPICILSFLDEHGQVVNQHGTGTLFVLICLECTNLLQIADNINNLYCLKTLHVGTPREGRPYAKCFETTPGFIKRESGLDQARFSFLRIRRIR